MNTEPGDERAEVRSPGTAEDRAAQHHGRHRRSGRGRLVGRIAWIVLAATVIVVVAIGGAFVWGLWSKLDSVTRLSEPISGDYEGRPDAATSDESGAAPLNILLLGSDSRDEGGDLLSTVGERADTIMVAHIPADRSSVQIVSILRDSWVSIDGYGKAKINAAYSYGSVPLMVQTVEQIIGQRVDHVALIDFEGFQGLTDALGGVSVYNEVEFSSGGHDFPAGQLTLDGEQALLFVRERYAFTDGDYQRARNQQAYLRAVTGQVLSAQTLTDPARIAEVLGATAPYITVDAALTTPAITELALSLRDVRRDDIGFFTAPTAGTGWEGDQSVVYLDWGRIAQLQQAFDEESLREWTR